MSYDNMEGNELPSTSSDVSEESSFRWPEEDSYRKSISDQEAQDGQERPLTFYLPSCHCLEERIQRYENAKFDMELREKEVNEVLAPEHPALQRFQKALKEHLQRQVERLTEEIYEFETTTKNKNAQKEEMGVGVYELQQAVCKQQKILEEYIDSVKTATAAREELELEVKECKQKFKAEADNLLMIQKEEKMLRNEVESINLLVQQTTNWEKEVESEIKISKTMTEKTRKDQLQLMEEKRKQDMVLYKLQTEVWKLETELETMDMKLEIKEREREELAQTVAEGTTTIDALEAEYRCLMHSWNSVVIAIGNRDKVLNCVNQEVHKYEEEFKNTVCETEQIRKLTKQEMNHNEKLTAIKQRILSELMTCKNQVDEELAKQKKLEGTIAKYQALIEQMELDINKFEIKNRAEETSLTVLSRECDKKTQLKCEWEEKIFLLLEDEVTNSKASQHLAARFRQMKCLNRKLEIGLALIENKQAKTQSKLESQMKINLDLNVLLKDLTNQKSELEEEINNFQDKLKNYENMVLKRQRYTDKLNNKILDMENVIGGREVSPTEGKIKTAEKNIEEHKERIKELQVFWMREQRNILYLSENRQEQISKIDLLRKQILILQQKNLRITDELESIKKQDQKTSRNISNLHNQIVMKSESLTKKKGEKKFLDASNELTQTEYMSKLKDEELECLRLEAHIADIEEDKLIMSKQLLDINREVLEWEKKLRFMNDTKNQIQEEKSAEGEIGQMRIEVHKMEVRYAQLKKAQERLITDLEQCVFRRESIVQVSAAREKRSKFGMEKTRINFKRRLDDTKNKIKQLENEMKVMANKIKKVSDEKRLFASQMKQIEEEVEEVKKVTENVLTEYENIKTDKMMQFELLILKQKKLNMYTDLARGKKIYLAHKNECALMREYNKNEEINNKLIMIVETLIAHFPHTTHYLNRTLNTLNLPKVYAGDSNEWFCEGFQFESFVT